VVVSMHERKQPIDLPRFDLRNFRFFWSVLLTLSILYSWYISFLIALFWQGKGSFGTSWTPDCARCGCNYRTLWTVWDWPPKADGDDAETAVPNAPTCSVVDTEKDIKDPVTGETLAPLQHKGKSPNSTTEPPSEV
jgi:hypothetical protein